ncbi:FtsX-like permease family protein [Mucilaginibacter sp. 14171R-50]|uniref:ABC transporter permease n=1 Tax=Mucilaginibacter sp. 14171R-50 TaxID=2703789 RepID=UPI00138C6B0E|nr:ABC transporter permease [Mucilaginibacter sp. 14171R-50]QHS55628.1 FtsX-like permease family protein [Mucilaginibacter sp. 14171R-50]
MFQNFLRSGLRNIGRHKGFSFINIAGLTIGLTACLLIGLFVRDEQQYDKFVPGYENTYRVYQKTKGDVDNIIATAPPAFAVALKQNFPEVEEVVRVLSFNSKELIEANDKKLYEENGFLVDSNFFEMFPLHFRYGSAAKVFGDPKSIVISAAMAEKFFGKENPIGKELTLSKFVMRVQGVLENSEKFHLPLNFVMPLAAAELPADRMQSWQWYPFNTYVKLKNGTSADQLQAKFQTYSKPFMKSDGPVNVPYFQSLGQIHLYSSDFKYEMSTRGNITYVKALSIIAIFILLIACFNFVNLATSRSLKRAKEVGVRKSIGAGRIELATQFVGETILLTAISMIIAIAATWLLLPYLNRFTDKNIVFDLIANPLVGLALVTLTLVVGILAGFYPALVLSAFQPAKVLKGSIISNSAPGGTQWLRHGLVVVQFSLSVLLIISAIVVINQVSYMHNKDLGFRKEQVLFFPMKGENLQKNYASFKNELIRYPGIKSVSIGYGFPGDKFGDGLMTVKEKPKLKPTKAVQVMVDEDYLKTLGLKLLAGRNFSKEIGSDVSAYIINETAVRNLGLGSARQAIGKTLSWPTWAKSDSLKTGPVIGVVKDFHYKSLHEIIEPAVLQIYPQAYSKVAVKISGSKIETTIGEIKKVWGRYCADYPIEYNFLDESFGKMYNGEDKLKTLLTLFTAITIFVSCLGLLGLAANAAERRKKELGVRKVLGATVADLVALLSKDFVKLVLISFLVACPIAWYFMNQWLDSFSYRITITWWMFAVAGALAVMLALVTVSFQSIKAALSNPVKNLRTE